MNTLQTSTTEEILAELKRREKINPNVINLTKIMHKIAEVHNVTINDIRGEGQCSAFILPRHQFCAYALRHTKASISIVSQMINKDITAVRRANEKHPTRLAESPKYEVTWRKLLEEIK